MDRRTFFSWFGLTVLASLLAKVNQKLSEGSPLFAAQTEITMKSITYYISPQGNDLWSGLAPQLEPGKKNGPFKTVEKAGDAIRQLKQASGGQLKQPITVILAGGVYFLEKSIELTVEDSGSEATPIIYQSDRTNPAILSGGKKIVGWQPETFNGKTVWTVIIPEVRSSKWYFEQLWVNGTRRHRARYPSQGYLKIKAKDVIKKFCFSSRSCWISWC
jgi:hypothetical protein